MTRWLNRHRFTVAYGALVATAFVALRLAG